MRFDIQQRVFDAQGEYLEDAAIRYREQLMDRFAASPEGQALVRQGGWVGWADTFMDLGIAYLGVTPAAMTPEQLQSILFELFPRKVSTEPGCGQEIIQELHAFWTFLQREFGLPNASACLRLLTTATARRLDRELQNPAKFGLAKAFLMQGLARGFDVATPEGMQAWAETYNAGLAGGTEPPLALPRVRASRATSAAAARRKIAQRSRRQNRKKR
jgi:hypothetical protein